MFENLSEAVDFIIDSPLDAHFAFFWEKYQSITSINKPFVILIGGQARSGKSTLASFLKIQFHKKGQKVLTVKADDWIMPVYNRSGNESVWERCRLNIFEKDMHRLFNNEPIAVQRYDSKSRALKEEIIYTYSHQDVVILEGVTLLHSSSLRNLADVSVFVEMDENKRKERFIQFYTWKGLSSKEIDLLYTERLNEEFKDIQQTAEWADIIIKK